MRTQKAIINSISSLVLQIITIGCGFILPKMILMGFGSEINGAATSIAQFLGYISLLEAGVGGVTRAALYKPLASKNYAKVSGISNATQVFFKKITYIFLIYTILLASGFNYISRTKLDWWYVFTLVIIISMSTAVQYYFGITYSLILQSDQRGYVSNFIQIVIVLLNTFITVILIKANMSFHVVKLASALVFIIRPLALNYIVKKEYKLDKNAELDFDAIKQRWSGLGHHLAFFIHNSTDIMVITMLLGLKWVSVYSIYYMIIGGVKNIVNSLTGGSEAAFGNMIAKEERNLLNNRFKMLETLSSMIIVIFFTTTGILLFDFIKIYTKNINDTNYILIPFGILFVISEALHCIRQNYHSIVLSAGHFKETQRGAFIEAGTNLTLSLILVSLLGIKGALIATIISTTFRTIDYVIYLKNNILIRSFNIFFRRQSINVLSVGSIIFVYNLIQFNSVNNYIEWFLKAIPVFFISFFVTLLWNIIFYKNDIQNIVNSVKRIVFK